MNSSFIAYCHFQSNPESLSFTNIIAIGSFIIALLVFCTGIYQYYINNKYLRVKNLAELWRRFYDNSFLMETFTFLNSLDNGTPEDQEKAKEALRNISEEQKLRFLAYLAEVVLYYDTTDKKNVIYLFHWHFYLVFIDKKVSSTFWDNIGGDEEKNSPSWAKDIKFAKECKKYIDEEKIPH